MRKKNLLIAISVVCTIIFNTDISFAQIGKNKLLFGVAYYDEYMPYDRLDKDISMMKETGINVVRDCRIDLEHDGTAGRYLRF
jgi:beta-galactosidase